MLMMYIYTLLLHICTWILEILCRQCSEQPWQGLHSAISLWFVAKVRMHIVSEEGRMAGGSCLCVCVPHVVLPVEGGIAPSLGMPVLGLEMLPQSRAGLPADPELQQAHRLQRLCAGGN